MVKAGGLHILIRRKLARLGGDIAGEKIEPRNADGHAQALRHQLISNDLDRPKWWSRKDKSGGEVKQLVGAIADLPEQRNTYVPDQRKPVLSIDSMQTAGLRPIDPVQKMGSKLIDSARESPDIPSARPPEATGSQIEPSGVRPKRATQFAGDTVIVESNAHPKWAKTAQPWGTFYRAGGNTDTVATPADMQHLRWGMMSCRQK